MPITVSDPSTPSVLTVGGSPVSLTTGRVVLKKLGLQLKGMDHLTFEVRGGSIAHPDPYCGKSVTLSVNGTTRFVGDVVSVNPSHTQIGYVFTYQCLGLRNRGDWVPHTDSNTGGSSSGYNLQPENPQYLITRAGRNCGQIITDVLTMKANANALNALGIGNYSGLPTTPTLPAATVSDLAALTVVPPHECHVTGERLLSAVEGFLSNVAPNCAMYVDPATGNIRFFDLRTFTNTVYTLDSDPIEVVSVSRDVGNSFQRVVVRGQPQVEPIWVSTSSGTLDEDFAWGSFATSAAAKAAWVPSDFSQPTDATDKGTCTCTTTTVTVTSSDASVHWVSNFWDQTSTGRLGVIYLSASSLSGAITQVVSRKIVSNTALTAGGTSVLTLNYPLPLTSYDSYWIHGDGGGKNEVWRKYKVHNAAVGAAMQRQFTYPVPWYSSAGNNASMTSTPVASICYSASGSPPYTEAPLNFTQDPSTGTILFFRPTSLLYGGGSVTTPPSDVRVLLAVAVGSLTATYPPDSGGLPVYGGTSHTVDGLSKTLVVQVNDWRDPTNQTFMVAYAQDIYDSVRDAVAETTVTVYGFFEPALTFGTSATVTGNGYTTGWETLTSDSSPGMAVVAVDLDWTQGSGPKFVTTLHCSNRRHHYGIDQFLRPERAFVPIGEPGDSDHVFANVVQFSGSENAGWQQARAAGLNAGTDAVNAQGADASATLANQGAGGALLSAQNNALGQGLSAQNNALGQGLSGMNSAAGQLLGIGDAPVSQRSPKPTPNTPNTTGDENQSAGASDSAVG